MPRQARLITQKPNNLREYRREKGITMWAIVAKTGISSATLSAIERYNYFPTYTVRERIAQALGISESLIWPYTKVIL